MDIFSPIQYIKGVGPRRAAILKRLGIETVKDLLFHLPSRYEDRSSIRKITQLTIGDIQTVTGKVVKSESAPASPKKPRLKLLSVVITDGYGTLTAKWFNQTYLAKLFTPPQKVVFYGTVKASYWGSGVEMISPEFEIIDDDSEESDHLSTGRIVPVYGLTEGISQRQMRSITHAALANTLSDISDPMPADIIAALKLPGLRQSIEAVHFPPVGTSINDLNGGTSPYHQRLSFDELFTLQLGLAAIKNNEVAERGIPFKPTGKLSEKLLEKLPFCLTAAQQRVIGDIMCDMESPHPMNRLIQGDVGSGKTIVAFVAMLAAVECGYQAALMAPTEILAEQHYMNIGNLAETLGLNVHLLTGSKKDKDYETISSGNAQLVIGTHALIQEAVSFNRLGLIVIDEQHRFGVMQRAKLRKKGTNPDTLIMTATPIPRTLAITLYGDLDYSLIDELPPNRTPVLTRIIRESQKSTVYDIIEEEAKSGRQVYVVYPLIEESDKSNLKAAITGMEALKNKFPALRVSLIHGKLPTNERAEIMAEFKKGKIHILVSTTVIEVGVDVPNATLMIIIHAERFGLSQLHQLRGRVGRGAAQSHCVLLTYGGSSDAMKRLDVMARTNDGFKIAERDLEIRGPGEFFGTKQSGLPDLKAANLLRDYKLLEIARRQAFDLMSKDPYLAKYPGLRKNLESFWGKRLDLFKTA
ncbi:MAG TPA: ATP-dependent DNA helicase RecG [Dissulfurispiraceae bacterium]|nr:ATP-dependent DNA helicase RecG [Dissulfurispiraceae bacterium]